MAKFKFSAFSFGEGILFHATSSRVFKGKAVARVLARHPAAMAAAHGILLDRHPELAGMTWEEIKAWIAANWMEVLKILLQLLPLFAKRKPTT